MENESSRSNSMNIKSTDNIMKKQLGYVIQRGTSPIDGNPFVVILTMDSRNRKTGNMPQVWILREDVDPVTAVQTGQDLTICGSCLHRRQEDGKRSCYVNPGQAPLSVWRAYHAGSYRNDLHCMEAPDAVRGRRVRFGAYGDPALISPAVFRIISNAADGHTAYTHQWREPFAQWARGAMQASCDGLADYLEASAHGWKTFRVTAKDATADQGKQCPATVAGSVAQCVTCALCDGAKADIWVQAHGSGARYIAA